MKNILKMIGNILLCFLAYFISSIVVGIIFGIVNVVKYVLGNPGFASKALAGDMQKAISQSTNLILVFTSILSLVFFWGFFHIRGKSLVKESSINERVSIKAAALIATAGVAFNIFVALALTYVVRYTPVKTLLPGYEKVSVSLFSGNKFWMILSICIVVPVFEEIFFRGLLFNELKKNMPLVLAIILQAGIFGLFHMNWIQGSYAFILGVISSLLLVWTRSMWASIIMHMFFNTTSVILNSMPDKEVLGQFGVVFLFLGLLICSAALVFVYRGRKVLQEVPVEESVNM